MMKSEINPFKFKGILIAFSKREPQIVIHLHLFMWKAIKCPSEVYWLLLLYFKRLIYMKSNA